MAANIRMVLEYDGTDFHGWQAQPAGRGLRTVQAEVEKGIATVTGERIKLVAAGRTDAGAHSLGQTVNFRLERAVDPGRLMRSLNGVLPMDVAVVAADQVADEFHARFSARRRRYRYLVENREARSTVLRERAWHVRRHLDISEMRVAAAALLGRNDLGAFGHDPAGRNNVRDLQQIRIRRLRGAAGDIIAFDLAADAFLYGMVRRIVGYLVEVGLGRRQARETASVLRASSPARSRVAPAHGLYQMPVEYAAAA
ncbi:MAG TPA: tRNA pseudouridine(38-40) synthase TruA [Candidatus Solibacter sp.]|nr:tRNA pseudouridine(38-40) synthase TruA [Candidatus Solibacter sp.]